MSLAGDVSRALVELRANAEALMVDACVVERVTGNATDPTTGEVTPTYSTVYAGKCKVQSSDAISGSSRPEAGERSFTVQALSVHLPVSVPGVGVGDRVRVTSAVHDGGLVGRVYRVTGLHHKSFATAQRLQVEEISG